MLKKLSIYSVALLVAFSAAAEPMATNLTPESAVTMALAGNRDLAAARFAIWQAEGRLKQAGLWPNPEFEVGQKNDRAFASDGQYDFATPHSTEFFQRQVRHSQLAVFHHSSHTPHLEEPEAYLATIREFLRRVDSSGTKAPVPDSQASLRS